MSQTAGYTASTASLQVQRLRVPLQGKFELNFLMVFGFVALADESIGGAVVLI